MTSSDARHVRGQTSAAAPAARAGGNRRPRPAGGTTIGELLDRVVAFEARLDAYYADIRDHSADTGARFLSYYLSRHGYRLQASIGTLSASLRETVRSANAGGRIAFSPEAAFHVIGTPPGEVDRSDLLDAALRYDAELAGMYRRILENTESPDVAAVIEGLILMEERDIIILRKIQAMQRF